MRGAFVAGCALACAQAATDLEQEFENWLTSHNKQYANDEEKATRFAIFSANFLRIQETNALNNIGYKLAVNEFADMSKEEFMGQRTGFKGSSDWEGLPYLGKHEVKADPPASVDWTTKGAVTPVKNQGQCGSCWSFSTTGSLEGRWQIASGNLVSLSEQQFVDCSGSYGNQGCNGGLMDNAFKFAEANAICTEESYSYTASDGTCKKSCTTGIPKGGVVGYKDVTKDDEQALMSAVAEGPVSIAIEADHMQFQFYHSGVLSITCGTKLDHGVLLVGYGTEDNKDYWLVKNSWGASWGDKGYIKLLRGKSGDGECGLKAQPSYPVVKASEFLVTV